MRTAELGNAYGQGWISSEIQTRSAGRRRPTWYHASVTRPDGMTVDLGSSVDIREARRWIRLYLTDPTYRAQTWRTYLTTDRSN